MKNLKIMLLFIIVLIMCIFIPALAGEIQETAEKRFVCFVGAVIFFCFGVLFCAIAQDEAEDKKNMLQFVGMSFLLGMSIFVLRLFI